MKRLSDLVAAIRPHRATFFAGLAMGAVFGVASGFGLPFITQFALPRIFGEQTESLWMTVVILAAIPMIFAFRSLTGYLNFVLIQRCGQHVLHDLRLRIFQKFQDLPLSWIQKQPVGDLISRLTADTQALQQLVTVTANDLIRQPITFLGAMGFLVYMSVTNQQTIFILFALAVIPLVVFPVRVIGRRLLKRALALQEDAGSMTARLSENLQAAREVRLFGLETRETEHFDQASQGVRSQQIRVAHYQAALPPLIEFIAACGITGAIAYAAYVFLQLEIVISLVVALYLSYEPLKKLGALHNQFRQAQGAATRIDDVLSLPAGLQTRPNAAAPDNPGAQIDFRQVGFAYAGEGIAALQEVSIHIAEGETVALVGPSGAGKTTFAHLVPRLADVSSGSVDVGGRDVRDWPLDALRGHIAYVSQDPYLFDLSVSDNLRLARPEASDAEVEAALRRAQAWDFVQGLPAGLETKLGEDAGRLSGGQRQRIAIARAFLRDAPILILDEPTSALDQESEARLQAALQDLSTGRTTLIIAHRASTLTIADRILVFEAGKLLGHGADRQQLARDVPTFARLYPEFAANPT